MMLVTFLCGYSPRKPLDIICFSTSRLPPANRSPNTSPRFSATCFATSTPTSSTSVAAPTGKPKLVVRESSFLGPTPSWIGSKDAPQGGPSQIPLRAPCAALTNGLGQHPLLFWVPLARPRNGTVSLREAQRGLGATRGKSEPFLTYRILRKSRDEQIIHFLLVCNPGSHE